MAKKTRCARNDYFLKLTKPTLVIIVDEPLTEDKTQREHLLNIDQFKFSRASTKALVKLEKK